MSPAGVALVSSCHASAAGAQAGVLPGVAVFTAGLAGMAMPCTVQMSVILASMIAAPGTAAPGLADAGRPPAGGVWALRTALFLSGYCSTFLAAAGAAAFLVSAVGWAAGTSVLQVAGGLTLAVFGLQVLGWLRLPGAGPCGGPLGFFLGRPYRPPPSPWRMGTSFALYCAGCCGPAALGSAMLLAGGSSPARAGLLLLAYAAGMAVPFVALAAGLTWALNLTRKLVRWTPAISLVGGVVAVVAGALLATRPIAAFLAS